MTNDKPKSHAESAQFHMRFAIMMLNCGRTEEANQAFDKADSQLARAIAAEQPEPEETPILDQIINEFDEMANGPSDTQTKQEPSA